MLTADTLGLDLGLAPGLSIKNAFLYLILLGIAIEAALVRNRRLELLSIVIPYAACIFYAIFTWVFVVMIIDYPSYSALRSLITLKGGLADHLLVFLAFFYGVMNSKDAVWLLKMMIWTVIIVNIISVVDTLNVPDLGLIDTARYGRAGGPMGEPNQYAVFLVLFLPAGIALVLTEQRARRKLAMLGVAASVIALVMTGSRGGIVGVVVGAALGIVFLWKFISAKVVVSWFGGLFLLAVAAVGILYMAGWGDLLYERFVLSTVGGSYHVSSGRTYIWGTALGKMFDQPLTLITGYGWATYSIFPEFRLSTHNTYLKIFFELGVIGLLLVLLAYASILRFARAGLRQAESEARIILFAFIIGLIGVLLAIFFVDLISPALLIWAYTGAAMRLSVLSHGSRIPQVSEPAVSGSWNRRGGIAGPA